MSNIKHVFSVVEPLEVHISSSHTLIGGEYHDKDINYIKWKTVKDFDTLDKAINELNSTIVDPRVVKYCTELDSVTARRIPKYTKDAFIIDRFIRI